MKVEKKNLLTIQDLLKFCQENKLYNFNSKDHGYKLKVQVPSSFEVDENVDDAHRGMLKLKIRIFHTGLNRNGSFVSEEAAKEAMPTIKNRPLLAAIHQLDNGEWDFEGHNFEIIVNDDGEEEVVYIEKQVGSFDESEPFFEYDEELDKTYICGYAYVSEDYTKAADIIRRKKGTKNSVELSIDEMSYNAKDNYLSLDKFYVSASTLLGSKKDGTEIGEGMLGSRADIADFSEQNNASQYDFNTELLNEIKKLNENLSHFNINQAENSASENFTEGGDETVKFNELLEKYGKTVDDITFEYENLSDEELEAKFAEMFEENTDEEGEENNDDQEPASNGDEEEIVDVDDIEENIDEENSDENVEENIDENTDEEFEEEEDVVEDVVNDDNSEVIVVESNESNESVKPEKYCITMSNGEIKEFALSLDEINNALYMLVNDTYGDADGAWYSVYVYEDNTLIMYDWWNSQAYRQSYKREEDNFSLVGDRVAVKQIWVTDEEEASLNEMKSKYAVLEQFKLDTENAQLRIQKEEILYNKKYSVLSEKNEEGKYVNEAFGKLVSEMDNYSLADLEKELKSVFADYITNGGHFSINDESEEKNVINKKEFAKPPVRKNSGRYGNLFNNK